VGVTGTRQKLSGSSVDDEEFFFAGYAGADMSEVPLVLLVVFVFGVFPVDVRWAARRGVGRQDSLQDHVLAIFDGDGNSAVFVAFDAVVVRADPVRHDGVSGAKCRYKGRRMLK
jgi:hypothetical protein